MGREHKWGPVEDEALLWAYVGVSEDPIHVAEQKQSTFWSSIGARYRAEVQCRDADARTDQALRNRWQTISHDVAKFVGSWSVIEARHESGKGPDDLVADARTLFAAKQGTALSFTGCWGILRKVPKFMAGISSQHKRRVRQNYE
jgi:hypothetical protein